VKEDAGLDAHGPRAEVFADFRQGHCRRRADQERASEMVVVVQTLEDVRRQDARVQIDNLHRIHAGLGDEEGVAQRLLRRGLSVRQRWQAKRGCGNRLEGRAPVRGGRIA